MPDAGFNWCNMDLRASLYMTDNEFAPSLHSSVFESLCAGQHPTGPVPTTTNFWAPRACILCRTTKKETH